MHVVPLHVAAVPVFVPPDVLYPVEQVALYVHTLPVVLYVQLSAPVPFVQALHVSTKQVPVDIVLVADAHTGVFHVFKFVIDAQDVLHDVFPVPVLYLPAAHAVHAPAPAALYDPATHSPAILMVSLYVPVLHLGIDASAGQYDPAGHTFASR